MGTSIPPPGRTPFPDCIVHDAGAGFIFGVTIGSAFHFLRGLRNSPAGHRLAGGAQAVRANAPRLAGSTPGFFVAFTAVQTAAIYARGGKDDPWNNIVASAGANGILSSRGGPMAACGSALFGAACWGFLEVVLIRLRLLTHYLDESKRNRSTARVDRPGQGHPATAASSDGDPAGAARCA